MMDSETLKNVTAHYRRLIKAVSALEERLAWTVIVPDSGPLSLQEVAIRLTGAAQPQINEIEPGLSDVAYLAESDATAMLYEWSGFSRATINSEILERLSKNARLWHVAWNITGMRTLIHASRGEVLAQLPEFDPDWLHGADPRLLQEEADIFRRVGRSSYLRVKATALALVAIRTGASLDKEWLENPHPAVLLEPFVNEE
jgi:hypothetical protein